MTIRERVDGTKGDGYQERVVRKTCEDSWALEFWRFTNGAAGKKIPKTSAKGCQTGFESSQDDYASWKWYNEIETKSKYYLNNHLLPVYSSIISICQHYRIFIIKAAVPKGSWPLAAVGKRVQERNMWSVQRLCLHGPRLPSFSRKWFLQIKGPSSFSQEGRVK
jgi:hypothetical protein